MTVQASARRAHGSSGPDAPARLSLRRERRGSAMILDRILPILSRLVAFDTTSRNSNLALIDWVEQYLRELGFTSERILDAPGTKANLFATIGPLDAPGYILSGHTDVVPVDGQSWTADP